MVKKYPSELSNKEWKLFAPLIPPAKPGGRPRSHSDREIINAILYVKKTGCQMTTRRGKRFTITSGNGHWMGAGCR